jgi:hypothetical protein
MTACRDGAWAPIPVNNDELKDTAFAVAESLVVNTTGEELMAR